MVSDCGKLNIVVLIVGSIVIVERKIVLINVRW